MTVAAIKIKFVLPCERCARTFFFFCFVFEDEFGDFNKFLSRNTLPLQDYVCYAAKRCRDIHSPSVLRCSFFRVARERTPPVCTHEHAERLMQTFATQKRFHSFRRNLQGGHIFQERNQGSLVVRQDLRKKTKQKKKRKRRKRGFQRRRRIIIRPRHGGGGGSGSNGRKRCFRDCLGRV